MRGEEGGREREIGLLNVFVFEAGDFITEIMFWVFIMRGNNFVAVTGLSSWNLPTAQLDANGLI